jgi:hypothetical protein
MSTAVATRTQYTPEDLLAMPDGKSYELVGGQLVERNVGLESSWVGGRLHSRPCPWSGSSTSSLAPSWFTALTARSAARERATSSRARMSYPTSAALCGISFHRAKRSYRARPHQTGLIRKINNDQRHG